MIALGGQQPLGFGVVEGFWLSTHPCWLEMIQGL
jgi:hypothetical protein